MPLTARDLATLVERAAAKRRDEPPRAHVVTPAQATGMRAERSPPAGSTTLRLPVRPTVPAQASPPGSPATKLPKTVDTRAKQPGPKPQQAKQAKPPKVHQSPLTPEQRHERFLKKLAKAGTSMDEINQLQAALMERWPAAFAPLRRRALAIGIHKAILAEMPDCNPLALSIVLRRWCSHHAYLSALANKHHRHDLQGNDVADITEDERLNARQALEVLRARVRAKPRR